MGIRVKTNNRINLFTQSEEIIIVLREARLSTQVLVSVLVSTKLQIINLIQINDIGA